MNKEQKFRNIELTKHMLDKIDPCDYDTYHSLDLLDSKIKAVKDLLYNTLD